MSVGGVDTRMVYDGDDVIADYIDYNGDGIADKIRIYWLYPKIDQRLGFIDIEGANVKVYYYLTDQVGSVIQIVDEDGVVVNQYDYDAFGNPHAANTFEKIENRYRFQGREWDAHRRDYYFRMRVYVPEWGSFTGADRDVRLEGEGVMNYLFANNNPLQYTDPRGLEPSWPGLDVDYNGDGLVDKRDYDLAYKTESDGLVIERIERYIEQNAGKRDHLDRSLWNQTHVGMTDAEYMLALSRGIGREVGYGGIASHDFSQTDANNVWTEAAAQDGSGQVSTGKDMVSAWTEAVYKAGAAISAYVMASRKTVATVDGRAAKKPVTDPRNIGPYKDVRKQLKGAGLSKEYEAHKLVEKRHGIGTHRDSPAVPLKKGAGGHQDVTNALREKLPYGQRHSPDVVKKAMEEIYPRQEWIDAGADWIERNR